MTRSARTLSPADPHAHSHACADAHAHAGSPAAPAGTTATLRAVLLAVALAGALGAAPALAAGPSYDHLDIEYGYGDYDDGDLDYEAHALRVRASAQVAGNFFVAGSYEYGQIDVGNLPGGSVGNFDSHVATLGAGAFLRLVDSDAVALDLTGEAFFIRADLEKNTDTGWGASIGPRVRFADRFELQAAATYFDVGDDGVWTFGIAGQADVTEIVAVRAGVTVDEDNDEVTYSIGARVHLGD